GRVIRQTEAARSSAAEIGKCDRKNGIGAILERQSQANRATVAPVLFLEVPPASLRARSTLRRRSFPAKADRALRHDNLVAGFVDANRLPIRVDLLAQIVGEIGRPH